MLELDEHKNEIKKQLKCLIDVGKIGEAEKIILEYEKIIEDDIDIISMKAVIFILKNQLEESERLLIKSLNKYGYDFDLLYNLAYLYEIKMNFEKSYYYYSQANARCSNHELQRSIQLKLEEFNNGSSSEKKKVLVISQIFPPMGGSGVQRTLKFVKYLEDFKWQPVVVTVGSTNFNYLMDATLNKEIPEQIDVIRFDENNSFDINQVQNLIERYKKLINDNDLVNILINTINTLIRENKKEELINTLLIPDLSSFWAIDVINTIDEFVDFNSIDMIYSTSGPYSDHIIGYFLKEKFNKPWVCDFRDEWTNNPYAEFNKQDTFYKIIRNMEKNILNKCDKLITISNLAKENYINDLKINENKIEVITNGYDEKDFENIKLNNKKNSKFTLIHNGMLYMIRTPKTFLIAIKQLIEDNKIDKEKIEIIFSYTENEEVWKNYLMENNMESIVTFKDYMNHNESIKLSMNSDLLLLIVGQGDKNKGVYTGKVFEYLRMNKPILALSPKNSVVEKLLKETNSGENYEFEDIDGISKYIYEMYQKWNKSTENISRKNRNVEEYNRKKLTNKLANIFNELLNNKLMIEKFEEGKLAVKSTIENLINQSDFEEADKIIDEYIKVVKNDLEIYSQKAVSLMMQNRFDEAERILNEGLSINENDFELNYNMGYLCEQNEKFDNSIIYYAKSIENCEDSNFKKDIYNLIERISYRHNVKLKQKIAFFVVQNGDSFINDIISGLSDIYETKKIIVTNYDQIDKGMEWADICWFEWCDQLIIYGSKHILASKKKIICRLHRYEALTNNPIKVTWENVDKLIIVTDHLKKFLLSQIPNIEEKVDIVTIKNGVDLKKYKFKKRNVGFNLAYVGYINERKNPALLLQIINKLVKKDERYKLYVAGKFQEPLFELYWNYQIEEMGLKDNVIFEGWQDNIDDWLEDKNYILVSTIHESFGYGIAEAMARGIKPIVHNFLFSKEIWKEKYLFTSLDEAVDMIMDANYDSKEYRNFIEENYSLESQIFIIKQMLSSLERTQSKDKLSYMISKFEEFAPYTCNDINEYLFVNVKVTIGKIERLNERIDLIEFIIKNAYEKQLVLQNIFYDKKNDKIILPEYIDKSNNKEKILIFINEILMYNLKYEGNMGGFINDIETLDDIKNNQLAYSWERGIPGTQFMRSIGYIRIVERYIFASNFIKDSDEVLEAASGFGYGAAYLSKKCKNLYALDLAKVNIDFGKNTYPKANIKWIEADVSCIPFKDNKFDVYTSFETLEHLPLNLVDKYFEEAIRVLKKEGCMILSTPNREQRNHINNPFHVKEYNFYELKLILDKFFKNVIYYSAVDYKIETGINENAINIIAVCSDFK